MASFILAEDTLSVEMTVDKFLIVRLEVEYILEGIGMTSKVCGKQRLNFQHQYWPQNH